MITLGILTDFPSRGYSQGDILADFQVIYFQYGNFVQWQNEAVHQLFIGFKKVYDSVRREALYNILIEFGIPKKLVRLIKMCLTAMYSRVWVGKNLSEMFPIRNGLKQGDALSPLLFSFALEFAIKRVQVNQDVFFCNCSSRCVAITYIQKLFVNTPLFVLVTRLGYMFRSQHGPSSGL